MNKKLITSSISVALVALPLVTLAVALPTAPTANANITVQGLIDLIFAILWPIAAAFFIIMFILAAFQFFTAQGDPEKIKSARNFVLWGIVGVAVAVLAFSLPFVIQNFVQTGSI